MRPELGVCYYPEHWTEESWATDAARMKDIGLSWVRIGEFAWKQMEPVSGRYDWNWLDKAIETLGRAGLKVVLGTPSATPPRWLIDKMPDCLAVDANGNKRKFGSRRHYCFSYELFREEAARIARDMAKRYATNPYIHAWQIDNEYGCHDTVLSYSQSAEIAFRDWLKIKYETIDALNRAWGNQFWSMSYDGFDQIELPNQTVTVPNPSHIMDFRRFSSDQVVRFNKAQVDAIKVFSDKPLIHNYMGRILDFDHFHVGEDLDIASWDSYPLGFLEDRSDQNEEFKLTYRRQGDPDFQAFHHDLYRAVGKGRWWVMEQQPGPVNWAPYNPAPLPGMVRLWAWEAIAHGAEVVSFFRWRQAPFGQEQMHAGLQLANGENSVGLREVEQVFEDLKQFSETEQRPSDVALIFDYESSWAWQIQPQGKEFDYFRLVYDFYRGLRRLGLSVDILPPSISSFGDRKLICIPGLFTWSESLQEAIENTKASVLIGPRTGSKTKSFQIPQDLPPNIKDFGCRVTSVETHSPQAFEPIIDGGSFHIWTENVRTSEKVIEFTESHAPALVAKENLYYLTGWPDDTAMTRLLKNVAAMAGLEITIMQEGIRRRQCGSYVITTDYNTGNVHLAKQDQVILEK